MLKVNLVIYCVTSLARTESHSLLSLPSLLQSTIHDNLLTSIRTVINGMNMLSIALASQGNEVRRLW